MGWRGDGDQGWHIYLIYQRQHPKMTSARNREGQKGDLDPPKMCCGNDPGDKYLVARGGEHLDQSDILNSTHAQNKRNNRPIRYHG